MSQATPITNSRSVTNTRARIRKMLVERFLGASWAPADDGAAWSAVARGTSEALIILVYSPSPTTGGGAGAC